MSRKFETWRDPYDEFFSTCRRKEIEINPGVTVLVGCNGAGKATLLHNIRDILHKEHIPYIKYYDDVDGRNSIDESFYLGHIELAAEQMCSSEGERININLGKTASRWRKFLSSGKVLTL